MAAETVFQKHVVDGPSYLFNSVLSSPNDEYALRHAIALSTDTSINDVIVIGSSKLGFSVKTEQFTAFDALYDETKNTHKRSDVDIALVNDRFFSKVAETIYHLSAHFDRRWIENNWSINRYYKNRESLFNDYAKYYVRGWLRPDFMPNLYLQEAAWTSPCEDWSNRLGRKVSIGLYSSWTYLKHYHMVNLNRLRAKLSTLEMK